MVLLCSIRLELAKWCSLGCEGGARSGMAWGQIMFSKTFIKGWRYRERLFQLRGRLYRPGKLIDLKLSVRWMHVEVEMSGLVDWMGLNS